MSKEYLPNLYDVLETSIEKLEYLIDSNGEPSEEDEFVDLSSDVLLSMNDVLNSLTQAQQYVAAVNWFMSGEDDESTFLSKMEDI